MEHSYSSFDYSAMRTSAFSNEEYPMPSRVASHSSSHSSGSSTPNSAESEWNSPSVNFQLERASDWSSGHGIPVARDHHTPENDILQNNYSYVDPYFGTRSFESCNQIQFPDLTSTFDDLMRQIQQQDAVDTLVYELAYEPLQWVLPSSGHQKGDSVSNSSLCNSVLGLSISDEAAKAASQPRRAYAPTKSRQERILHRSPLSRERRTRETGSTHACNQCSCTFARARDLKRHYRLHTGEKPYQCLGCSEGFIRVDARKRHWTCNPECLALHQNSSSSSSC